MLLKLIADLLVYLFIPFNLAKLNRNTHDGVDAEHRARTHKLSIHACQTTKSSKSIIRSSSRVSHVRWHTNICFGNQTTTNTPRQTWKTSSRLERSREIQASLPWPVKLQPLHGMDYYLYAGRRAKENRGVSLIRWKMLSDATTLIIYRQCKLRCCGVKQFRRVNKKDRKEGK
jgi:hypothetical protein